MHEENVAKLQDSSIIWSHTDIDWLLKLFPHRAISLILTNRTTLQRPPPDRVHGQTSKFLPTAAPSLSAPTSLTSSTQNKRQAKQFLKFPPKLTDKANSVDNITPCKPMFHNDPTSHHHKHPYMTSFPSTKPGCHIPRPTLNSWVLTFLSDLMPADVGVWLNACSLTLAFTGFLIHLWRESQHLPWHFIILTGFLMPSEFQLQLMVSHRLECAVRLVFNSALTRGWEWKPMLLTPLTHALALYSVSRGVFASSAEGLASISRFSIQLTFTDSFNCSLQMWDRFITWQKFPLLFTIRITHLHVYSDVKRGLRKLLKYTDISTCMNSLMKGSITIPFPPQILYGHLHAGKMAQRLKYCSCWRASHTAGGSQTP